MNRIERRRFTASLLALALVTRPAFAAILSVSECPYVYPVGVWRGDPENLCTAVPDDPDDDPEIIEVSTIDLRGL